MIRATIRATVRAEGVTVRQGNAKNTGNPYRMEVVQVLDEDLNKVEVTIPDQFPHDQSALLVPDAEVDIVADIVGRGQFESARLVKVTTRRAATGTPAPNLTKAS